MSDLRQAAKAVLDAWDSPLWKTGTTAAKIADLRAALAMHQAEPVAWDNCRSEKQCRSWCGNSACASHWENITPPQQQAEPVYQIKVYGSQTAWHDAGLSAYVVTPSNERRILYTTPPQRQWVGLTRADIDEIWKGKEMVLPWDYDRTLAIEAKLKERNT